jgi:hypothetical protein
MVMRSLLGGKLVALETGMGNKHRGLRMTPSLENSELYF